MLTFVTFVLSFVASTLAYTVVTPSNASGWSNSGGQLVSWTRVNTDPSNFSISLVNQQLPGFITMQLVALVQSEDSAGNATVNPPAGGWVPAPNYRVNLVKFDDNNTIYAQSEMFTINGSSTSTSTSGSTTRVATTGSTSSTGATETSDSNASESPSILPTSSSAAALSYAVQTGLLGLFSLLGFAALA